MLVELLNFLFIKKVDRYILLARFDMSINVSGLIMLNIFVILT